MARFYSLDNRNITGNKLVGGAAASTYDVDKSLVDVFGNLWCHRVGCLVVQTERIGQSGIGMATHIIWSLARKMGKEGFHLTGTKGAVETYGEDVVGAYACEEGIECLSAKCAPCKVAHRHRHHYGHIPVKAANDIRGGIHCHLGVEGVEDGFDEQHVNPSIHQCLYLLGIGGEELVVGKFAQCRIADIGTHRAGLVGGTNRSCHKTRASGG